MWLLRGCGFGYDSTEAVTALERFVLHVDDDLGVGDFVDHAHYGFAFGGDTAVFEEFPEHCDGGFLLRGVLGNPHGVLDDFAVEAAELIEFVFVYVGEGGDGLEGEFESGSFLLGGFNLLRECHDDAVVTALRERRGEVEVSGGTVEDIGEV